MRKSLALKLITITSSVFLISLLIFLLVITTIFKKKYIEINNARLIQFVTSTASSWKNGNMSESGYEYIYGSTTTNSYETSSNITSLIDNSTIKQIIKDFKSSRYKISPVIKTYKNNKIYACGYSQDDAYIIAISDNSYISSQTRSLVVTTSIIFIIIIILADSFIYLYSRRMIKRIYNIKNEIVELPNNEYKKELNDYGIDEIGELASGVEDLRKNILQSNMARTEMFQNLSHDLKTPISVIKSYTEAIKDGIEDINSIGIIENQANILETKANKLLELNKIEYIKDSNFENINLKNLIIEVCKNYKFDFDLELENVEFKGFYENYRTVIENLIENALRYKNEKIKIILKDNYLEVFNDGKKIDDNLINSIFDPYVKGIDGNFGVGLSIVKRTMDVFGYDVRAKNLESGVAFIITKRL